MEIERLSGDFVRGYTKAIQDVIKIFDYIQDDLRYHHKSMTGKIALEILRVILAEREKLREDRDGFIRYNGTKKQFEFYSPNNNCQ